jgi:hypothetical protein
MSFLYNVGVVSNADGGAAQIFESLHPNFMTLIYDKPSDYIKAYWKSYKNYIQKDDAPNNSQNGKVFEYILATLFIRENLVPLFLGATVAFVPNVTYDMLLYAPSCGPICLSIKTSLRERYKQADLEAIALKYVHRKALAHLITLDEQAALSCKEKIRKGDIIGLDDVVVATLPEFDELITKLKKLDLKEAPTVKIIEAQQIITAEKIKLLT